MGTESIGRGSVRHGRNDRLPNGSVSQVDKLLVVPGLENDAVSQQEVRDVGRGKQLSHSHAADHQRPGPIGFRKLQVHIQELVGRDGRLHQTLRYVHGALRRRCSANKSMKYDGDHIAVVNSNDLLNCNFYIEWIQKINKSTQKNRRP